MVRKEGSGRLAAEYQGLEVKVPTFFRCPISLDVMRSPVSLCTGVTYDRASIQRWIDSGNATCPATMLPLPSTDLVPNLTLRRLIALWASTAAPSSSSSSPAPSAVGPTPAAAEAELLRQVAAPGMDPCPALRKLAAFLSDDDVDEFDKNALVRAGGAAETVATVLRRRRGKDAGVEAVEAVLRGVAMMKGGMGGAEAAVSVLWAVCHRYKDRRAVDAAAASKGGLTKLLLLMQSGCSPAARQMASELLKMFKVNAKSCLAGYDSKTTHIMPF
uniref:U-box domain-containing protein n=1 Tax=Oryza brachyantha TaxID=4533 RepID=J3LDL7_ORYBR